MTDNLPNTSDASDTPAPRSLFETIDQLLRGQLTSPERLRRGQLHLPIGRLILACLGFGAFYGAMMGLFAVTSRPGLEGWLQVFSSAAKVPLLFVLTLAVTFPSLYVISSLARSRLRATDTLRLLLAAIAVNLVLLASLGPVAAFFTLSTGSYSFMKLLHVLIFSAAGFVGVSFLRRCVSSLLDVGSLPATPQPTSGSESDSEDDLDTEAETEDLPSPRAPKVSARIQRQHEAEQRTTMIFRVWLVVFGVVGAQMGWILRPFIGSPNLEFSLFRERSSNIFAGVLEALANLFR